MQGFMARSLCHSKGKASHGFKLWKVLHWLVFYHSSLATPFQRNPLPCCPIRTSLATKGKHISWWRLQCQFHSLIKRALIFISDPCRHAMLSTPHKCLVWAWVYAWLHCVPWAGIHNQGVHAMCNSCWPRVAGRDGTTILFYQGQGITSSWRLVSFEAWQNDLFQALYILHEACMARYLCP